MAKPRSEDKRNSILSAATKVFAERGLGAPTAAITSAAGIAEGSLFTYFKTKDELINALYRELKLELADAMMSGFPRLFRRLHSCARVGSRPGLSARDVNADHRAHPQAAQDQLLTRRPRAVH